MTDAPSLRSIRAVSMRNKNRFLARRVLNRAPKRHRAKLRKMRHYERRYSPIRDRSYAAFLVRGYRLRRSHSKWRRRLSPRKRLRVKIKKG